MSLAALEYIAEANRKIDKLQEICKELVEAIEEVTQYADDNYSGNMVGIIPMEIEKAWVVLAKAKEVLNNVL